MKLNDRCRAFVDFYLDRWTVGGWVMERSFRVVCDGQ
jgi:hypothetical protein